MIQVTAVKSFLPPTLLASHVKKSFAVKAVLCLKTTLLEGARTYINNAFTGHSQCRRPDLLSIVPRSY